MSQGLVGCVCGLFLVAALPCFGNSWVSLTEVSPGIVEVDFFDAGELNQPRGEKSELPFINGDGLTEAQRLQLDQLV